MATEHPQAHRKARRQMRPSKKQFEETLDLLYRRRWIIVGTFLLVAAAVGAWALSRTPVYQATAVVLIDLQRSVNAEGSETGGATPFVRDNRTTETELFILQASRGIAERVAERMRAERGGELPPGDVTFTPVSRSVNSAIQIVGTSPDPQAAAAWANAFAEEYVEQTRTSSRSYLTESRRFLEEQAARLRGELSAAESRVAGRMAAAGTAVVGSGALVGQLQTLRAQRDEAMIDLQMRQNQLAQINRQLNDISPRLADRMSSNVERQISTLDAQIAEQVAARRPLEEFEARRGNNDPTNRPQVQQIDRRIEDLERQKAALTQRYVGEVMGAGGIAAPEAGFEYITGLQGQASQERVAISGLEGRIGQLSARIGQIQGDVSRVPGQTTALNSVQRDEANAAQTYQLVMQRLQQVQIAEESEPGYARILREASVPMFPGGEGPYRNLLFGLLGGLGLGLVLAFARDKVDNRIHKPDHVAAFGVPVLEAIPDLRSTIKDLFGGAPTVELGGRDVAADLIAAHAPLSPASETYRHLRTRVQFSRPGMVVRSVVVTSGGPSEGKSTTAANLAVTFAQAGRRTVLIDADLRRPRQHVLFGVDGTTGLGQLLALSDPTPADLQPLIDGTFAVPGVENLSVIPTGAVAVESAESGPDDGRILVPNPSELLGSPEMRALLAALLDTVDVVVVDTPPVLAATDAVLLSTQADATLLVTCAGETKGGDIEQSLGHLDDVGAEVIGAVLNRFSLEHAAGYVYTYGHYSRYGPYSKYGAYTEGTSKRPGKGKAKRAA